jgi:hypothetical protein
MFSICSVFNKINTNKYLNLKTNIDIDFFKKFVDEIKLKKKDNVKSIEELIDFCLIWGKKIDD